MSSYFISNSGVDSGNTTGGFLIPFFSFEPFNQGVVPLSPGDFIVFKDEDYIGRRFRIDGLKITSSDPMNPIFILSLGSPRFLGVPTVAANSGELQTAPPPIPTAADPVFYIFNNASAIRLSYLFQFGGDTGLKIDSGASDIIVSRCSFMKNIQDGAALFSSSDIILNDCIFAHNSGNGVNVQGSNSNIIKCSLDNNSVGYSASSLSSTGLKGNKLLSSLITNSSTTGVAITGPTVFDSGGEDFNGYFNNPTAHISKDGIGVLEGTHDILDQDPNYANAQIFDYNLSVLSVFRSNSPIFGKQGTTTKWDGTSSFPFDLDGLLTSVGSSLSVPFIPNRNLIRLDPSLAAGWTGTSDIIFANGVWNAQAPSFEGEVMSSPLGPYNDAVARRFILNFSDNKLNQKTIDSNSIAKFRQIQYRLSSVSPIDPAALWIDYTLGDTLSVPIQYIQFKIIFNNAGFP